MTVKNNGAVIANRVVSGGINVEADDVTIKNTEVITNDPQGGAITIVTGAHGTVIKDTTVRGNDAATHGVEYAIDNQSDSSLRAINVALYNCTECFAGPGLLSGSWVDANASIPGAHYEATYYGGGSQYLTIEHDTLINPHEQTAVVYTNPDFGRVFDVTIADTLLSGGGYTIYGGQSSRSVAGSTHNIRILFNRIATNFFSPGGSDGWLAYFSPTDSGDALAGNIWDGNGATLSANGAHWTARGPQD